MTNGIINTNNNQMIRETITRDIPFKDIELEVRFDVYGSYGNRGIGSYEYWGFRERDDDYRWEIEDVKWDKELYSPEENKVIEKYVEDEHKSLEKEYIKIATEYPGP